MSENTFFLPDDALLISFSFTFHIFLLLISIQRWRGGLGLLRVTMLPYITFQATKDML